jgi:hypothetical protein
MKKTIPIALALMAGGLLIPLTASAQDRDEVDEAIARLREADSGIDSFFANSEGYAIFPSVGKGGFGIGAAHGDSSWRQMASKRSERPPITSSRIEELGSRSTARRDSLTNRR